MLGLARCPSLISFDQTENVLRLGKSSAWPSWHMCFPFSVFPNSNLYNFLTVNNHSTQSQYSSACGEYTESWNRKNHTTQYTNNQSIKCILVNNICNKERTKQFIAGTASTQKNCDCNLVEISFDPYVARHSKITSQRLRNDVCVCVSNVAVPMDRKWYWYCKWLMWGCGQR